MGSEDEVRGLMTEVRLHFCAYSHHSLLGSQFLLHPTEVRLS